MSTQARGLLNAHNFWHKLRSSRTRTCLQHQPIIRIDCHSLTSRNWAAAKCPDQTGAGEPKRVSKLQKEVQIWIIPSKEQLFFSGEYGFFYQKNSSSFPIRDQKNATSPARSWILAIFCLQMVLAKEANGLHVKIWWCFSSQCYLRGNLDSLQ